MYSRSDGIPCWRREKPEQTSQHQRRHDHTTDSQHHAVLKKAPDCLDVGFEPGIKQQQGQAKNEQFVGLLVGDIEIVDVDPEAEEKYPQDRRNAELDGESADCQGAKK